MWAAVIEVLPGPEWFGTGAKMGYIAAVRVVSTILGNVLVWSGTPFYVLYEEADRPGASRRRPTRGSQAGS